MTKWISSDEKNVLRKDILSGAVLDDMPADLVYDMHDGIYDIFPFEKFKTNLRNLQKAIRLKKEDAQRDEELLRNTLQNRPNVAVQPPYPSWGYSEAQTLLSNDIKSGSHLRMKPSELWSTREEYMVYPISVFRDHLYKEITKPVAKAYWDHQREMQAKKKQQKK